MPYKPYHIPRRCYVMGLSQGIEFAMSSCLVFKSLAVGWMGGFGAQTKSFFHGHTLGLLQAGNQPTPRALPFREPSRFFFLLGSQVGAWTVQVQGMKQSTQSRCSGTTHGMGWEGKCEGSSGWRDTCAPPADSCWCLAKNTILWSNYLPIKMN